MDIQEAQHLANTLMQQHNLRLWNFKFDNAKRRFGLCSFNRKTISLSKTLTLLNDKKTVKGIILHEIAHALTEGHYHDQVWQRKLIEIGGDGQRCYDIAKVNTPESKYIAECPKCGYIHKRHKLPIRARRLSCGQCSRSFDPNNILTYKLNPNY